MLAISHHIAIDASACCARPSLGHVTTAYTSGTPTFPAYPTYATYNAAKLTTVLPAINAAAIAITRPTIHIATAIVMG